MSTTIIAKDAPLVAVALSGTTVIAGVEGAPGASTAAGVAFTPAGGIAAVTVQDAIVELDTEKAPKASPTFTGVPAAPTAAGGTNTTQIATTAFVRAEVAAVVASAPGALDTLDELAAALGDDANYAASMVTALAGKQPIDPSLTAYAALVTGADKFIYFTGADTPVAGDFTGVARTLVAQTTQALMRTAGLGFSADASDFVAAADNAAMRAAVGLGNVDNTADTAKPVSTAQQTALNLKADLASPPLTGTPTAPTAAGGTNTTQVATTAFVKAAADAKVTDAIVDGVTTVAPSQNAVFDALALKAPLVSPSFTTPTLGVASATSLALGGAITGATTGAFSGQVTTPKVGATSSNAIDFSVSANSQIKVSANGTNVANWASNRLALAADILLSWTSTAGDGSAANDLNLCRAAAATLQQGKADAAAPVAQKFQAQSVVAGTTDTAGVDWTFAGSKGTGAGAGGSLVFQVAPAGSTGSTQNAHATAVTIDSTKLVTLAAGMVLGGPLGLKSYTVGTVPLASANTGKVIWVSNESGGACSAESNGTNWLRIYDHAIIS